MSAKPTSPYLSLACEFIPAEYIGFDRDELSNPRNQTERAWSLEKMRAAANMAGITDYKLYEEYDANIIYLRTARDLFRYRIARKEGDLVMGEFVAVERDFDLRKLKHISHVLKNTTDKAGFGSTIDFDINRKERSIFYVTSSKSVYFKFDAFVEQNRESLSWVLALQRKEPELALSYPTKDEATRPDISFLEDEHGDDDPLPETDPKSMGITIGGKPEHAEKSQDRSHLSLVKSFAPKINGYNHKISPNISVSPKSESDFLFRNFLDYPAFRIASETAQLMNKIRFAMNQAEVKDYHLTEKGGQIEAWFKDTNDLLLASACVKPDKTHHINYLHCVSHISPMKISRKAKKIQEIFAKTGERVNVKFVADKERCIIPAIADSGDDLIRLQGITRRLEKTHPKFQSLIGLKKDITP